VAESSSITLQIGEREFEQFGVSEGIERDDLYTYYGETYSVTVCV
jgi:hypothetical protein